MDLLREEALERRHKAGKRRGEKDLFVLRVTHKTALNPSGSLQPLSPAKKGGGGGSFSFHSQRRFILD